MASYNRVVLVGNLTRDPELRYISSGTAVTELGLAVNDRKKSSSGEWVEDTQFIDITLWARTAEVASEYLGKGSSLLIEGRLKLDRWEKDDKKYSKLRVVGEKMEFLDKRERGSAVKSGGGPSSSTTASAGVADTAPAIDSEPPPDDIPF